MAEKTVNNFAELKAAVEDGETDSVILAENVTFTSGIKIPLTKKTLVINCNGKTVTDMVSSSYSDALYLPAGSGGANVTVKNGVWSGRNYYGVVCVYDDVANASVTITLQNLTYNGPQAVYNRYGTTVINGGVYAIEKNGTSVNPQEFGEVNRLIFEGDVSINSAASSTAVLWFPFAGAALTVAENAKVKISAPQTYLIYSDSAAKPQITIYKNADFSVFVKNGLFYSSGSGAHIASSCTIEQNARFYASSEQNNGVPLFKCAGAFTVKSGGSAFLIMQAAGSSPVLYFSTAAELRLEKPKNILFYSGGGKVFSFASGSASSPNVAEITAKQINLWLKTKTPFSSAGGFDDPPSFAFSRADKEHLKITQKLSSSAALSVESDLTEGDEGYPVSLSNYNLLNAAVLSAGELPLEIEQPNDLSVAITGVTDPGAALQFTAEEQSGGGTANEQGEFLLPLNEKLQVESEVFVKANSNFLTESGTASVEGSVSITYLPNIPFNAFAVPKRNAPVKRLDENWRLEITDTRVNGGKWSLYVTLETPLHLNEQTDESAVIFGENNKSTVLTQTPLLVKSGVTDKPQTITVFWIETEGILLDLSEQRIYEKGKWTATLKWSVVPN